MLLDEADIYLGSRNQNEVEHKSLVSDKSAFERSLCGILTLHSLSTGSGIL